MTLCNECENLKNKKLIDLGNCDRCGQSLKYYGQPVLFECGHTYNAPYTKDRMGCTIPLDCPICGYRREVK